MCYIVISVDEEDRENVEISVGVLKMDTERELAKYFVVKDSPSLLQINPHEIRMKMIFKRRLTSETMKAFFPSLLLICCSYTTSFFRLPNFFNTAITANLTVLLTVTTLMFRVMERIAETSYIKWIEFWLLFGTFVPSVQDILITIIEWLRNKEETEKKRQKESKGNVGLERSSELYEMSVGGKKVKVNNRLYPFYLFSSHTQVHPLITQVLPNDETRSKVKDFLTLGETSNILNNPSANLVLQDEGSSAF